jgi:hypothetical protein
MACKKGFLSSSHAPMKDKNFYLNFRKGTGRLPLSKFDKERAKLNNDEQSLYDSINDKFIVLRKF